MIVAQAGKEKSVTIATNMAGRGTDIILGGNPQLLADDILHKEHKDEEEITPEMQREALETAKEMCAEDHQRVVDEGGLYMNQEELITNYVDVVVVKGILAIHSSTFPWKMT